MNAIPSSVTYAVIGAGIHGLSTAWHLAMELEAKGKGGGKDIVVLDKTAPGAGASGIACGCVRNLYMTEPLHAILRHSVDVWMSDPVRLGFQQVGYVSAGEANQLKDYEKLHASQNRVGYPSDLYSGQDAKTFLKGIWPDFNVEGIDVALHEKLSGYAGTRQAVAGLAQKCADHGVRVLSGVEVTGYDMQGGRVSKLKTNQGDIKVDVVVLGLGAWTGKHWGMLGLPDTLDLTYRDGATVKGKDMWTYWRLLEGEVYIDKPYRTADDRDPPVLHVELMTTPVHENGDPNGTGARGPPLRLLEERRRTHGKAWSSGRHDPDQDRAEGDARSLWLGQRRIPGGAGIRRLPDRGDGPADAALQGSPEEIQGAAQRRHRRLHPGQRADLRLDQAQRLHDRRQQPRL